MRCIIIDDHSYDIHKLQEQRKYEGQSRINEIEIEGVKYEGLGDVVKAISKKISAEVGRHLNRGMEESTTTEEEYFLSKLRKINITEEERRRLTGPTESEEVEYILTNEVDFRFGLCLKQQPRLLFWILVSILDFLIPKW